MLTTKDLVPDCSEIRDEAETMRQELGEIVRDLRGFVARIRENPSFYEENGVLLIAEIIEETING